MHPTRKQHLGSLAESEACQFLTKNGLILLEKNFRIQLGEIDLIMQDGDHIVFVEVRSRSRADYGQASESVNLLKQSKIIKTATYYLQKKGLLYKKYSRFDVVSVHFVNGKITLDWFKNAFLAR